MINCSIADPLGRPNTSSAGPVTTLPFCPRTSPVNKYPALLAIVAGGLVLGLANATSPTCTRTTICAKPSSTPFGGVTLAKVVTPLAQVTVAVLRSATTSALPNL